MSSITRHPLRTAGRLIWLGAELSLGALAYYPKVVAGRQGPLREARARWLQWICRRLWRVFNIDFTTQGAAPTRGLLTSNHLSYLDIVVLGAVMPTVFVSKSDVARWPVFGWFATMSGTVYVHREHRADVSRSGNEIKAALAEPVLIVLFPEGTSSDGQTVLPFKSSLLEPAVGSDAPLAVSHIRYSLTDGNPGEDVCYWRDMTLVPHLLNLLSKERVQVELRFASIAERGKDRKELAKLLHAEILKLRAPAESCAHQS